MVIEIGPDSDRPDRPVHSSQQVRALCCDPRPVRLLDGVCSYALVTVRRRYLPPGRVGGGASEEVSQVDAPLILILGACRHRSLFRVARTREREPKTW